MSSTERLVVDRFPWQGAPFIIEQGKGPLSVTLRVDSALYMLGRVLLTSALGNALSRRCTGGSALALVGTWFRVSSITVTQPQASHWSVST
jgi:hypothetical protein